MPKVMESMCFMWFSLSRPGKTYMCGDEGCWIRQLVVSPHPEREEDDGGQADYGNQGVKQRAEELWLLGKRVGGGCEKRKREDGGTKRINEDTTCHFLTSFSKKQTNKPKYMKYHFFKKGHSRGENSEKEKER